MTPTRRAIASIIATTAVIAMLCACVGTGNATIRIPATSTPSPSASKHAAPANYDPAPTPKSDLLTSADLTCGAKVAADVFTARFNQIAYTDSQSDVAFDFTNAAATADGTGTVVSARLSADSSDRARTGDGYGGALRIALVQHGVVVATEPALQTASGLALPRRDETALISTTFTATSCSSGKPAANGGYSVVGFGLTVTAFGETVHPAFAVPGFRLRDGILTAGTATTLDGPWRGSGVPTCGTPVSAARLAAFAAANAQQRARAGIAVHVTGFVPHANAQGFDFDIRVTNTGHRTVRLTDDGATTAVVDHGKIVSAPDSEAPPVRVISRPTLAAGKSVTTESNAATSGCDLTADGTGSGPVLSSGTHFAYVDLGMTTSTGLPIVITLHYGVHGYSERPTLLE